MKSRVTSSVFAFFGVLISASSVGFAQNSEGSGRDALQEVVVTGSRIPVDPNLVASTPVQFLDEAALRLSGEINLAEIVNDIPALVASIGAVVVVRRRMRT